MEIKRDAYLEQLKLRKDNGMIKIITGIRRCGKSFLLLDEVQFMPRFEEVLNSLLRIHNIDVYVTGSNSKFLSSDIVTEFRCMGGVHDIWGLTAGGTIFCGTPKG